MRQSIVVRKPRWSGGNSNGMRDAFSTARTSRVKPTSLHRNHQSFVVCEIFCSFHSSSSSALSSHSMKGAARLRNSLSLGCSDAHCLIAGSLFDHKRCLQKNLQSCVRIIYHHTWWHRCRKTNATAVRRPLSAQDRLRTLLATKTQCRPSRNNSLLLVFFSNRTTRSLTWSSTEVM